MHSLSFTQAVEGPHVHVDVEEPHVDGEEVDIDELDPPKVLGDVLESLAGAIFVDSGMSLDSVWTVFRPLFEEKIGEYIQVIPYAIES